MIIPQLGPDAKQRDPVFHTVFHVPALAARASLRYNLPMRLNHLTLHNFRNYVRLEIDLSPGVTLLAGDNAQGKTNLLESIYYLATSRSPHAGSDREIVNWLAVEQEPLPYARLVGRVARTSGPVSIEITLTRQANNGGRYKKEIRINGTVRRAMDMLGQLNVVLFLPEDLTLVSGSPGDRRRYLDVTLCQVDAAYCRSLSRYNSILTQRNALLRELRERGRSDGEQLAFWDDRLVESGAYLVTRRVRAVQALDTLANRLHGELTAGMEALHLRYEPSLDLDGLDEDTQSVEAVARSFRTQVRAQRSREVAAGMTLVGPHRDEMRFLLNGVDAGVYGSRGQQRTAALALKLAEVRLMRQETGEEPVLLLDDVLSELDAHRRAFLLEALACGVQQSILTTTDLGAVPGEFRDQCQVWQVEAGRLSG